MAEANAFKALLDLPHSMGRRGITGTSEETAVFTSSPGKDFSGRKRRAVPQERRRKDSSDQTSSDEETWAKWAIRAGEEPPIIPPEPIKDSDRIMPAALESVKKLLIERYKQTLAEVDDGTLKDGLESDMDKIHSNIVNLIAPEAPMCSEFSFFPLAASSIDNMQRLQWVMHNDLEPPTTLEQLVDKVPSRVWKRERTFCVIVAGMVGSGKTYIFTKLAPAKWAVGKMWQQVDVLFVRDMRFKEVRRAQNIRELFDLAGLGCTEEEMQEIVAYVEKYPKRICIILDSFSEATLKKCSKFVEQFIRGKVHREIKIILPSRPNEEIFDLQMKKRFGRIVELLGFYQDDKYRYIRNALDADDAEALIAEMKTDVHFDGLFIMPVHTMMLCKLYRSRKQAPHNPVDMIDMWILYIAERYTGTRYNDWVDIPSDVMGQILRLCDFALHMMLRDQFQFTDQELKSFDLPRESLDMGFLVRHRASPKSDESFHTFTAVIVQEGLAAKAVLARTPHTVERMVDMVEAYGNKDLLHLRSFWIFLIAQLDNKCAEAVLNSVLMREKCRHRWPDGKGREIITSADTFPFAALDLITDAFERSQMNYLAEALLQPVISCGYGQRLIENKVPHNRADCPIQFMKTLFQTWREQDPKGDLKRLFDAMCTIDFELADQISQAIIETSADLDYDYSSKLEMPGIWYWSQRDGYERNLAYTAFTEYAHRSKDKCQPLPTVSALTSRPFSTLHLYATSPTELYVFEQVIDKHADAVRCLALREYSPKIGSCMRPCLAKCCSLTELKVYDSFEEWPMITTIVKGNPATLKSLFFCNVKLTDEETDALVPQVLACTKLTKLDYRHMRLSHAAAKVLVTSLQPLEAMEQATLDEMKALNDEVGQLAMRNLTGAHSLEALVLRGSRMTAASLPTLAECLSSWPKLKSVDIEGLDLAPVTEEQMDSFIAALNNRENPVRIVRISQKRDTKNEHISRLCKKANTPRWTSIARARVPRR